MNLDSEYMHESDDAALLPWAEAGGKTALICIADQALSDSIAQSVAGLDYHVIVAQEPSSALTWLEYGQCELIVLDENYGGTGWSENPVLLNLQRQPTRTRRKSFVCLLSEQTPTLDHMAAFRCGANMILNFRNILKMQVILQRAIKDHEAFYAVFKDELAKRASSV